MNQKNNIAVIIPAAGSSSRFGEKISKQFKTEHKPKENQSEVSKIK